MGVSLLDPPNLPIRVSVRSHTDFEYGSVCDSLVCLLNRFCLDNSWSESHVKAVFHTLPEHAMLLISFNASDGWSGSVLCSHNPRYTVKLFYICLQSEFTMSPVILPRQDIELYGFDYLLNYHSFTSYRNIITCFSGFEPKSNVIQYNPFMYPMIYKDSLNPKGGRYVRVFCDYVTSNKKGG